MVCDICGKGGARLRRTAITFGRGKSLFVIENVPLLSRPNCRESYFTAETLHEVERIKLHRESFAIERLVEVAAFV